MPSIRRVLLVIVAGMLTSLAGAQTSAPAPAATAAPAPTAVEKAQWLERANLITAAIQEDAANLPPNLQFVLPGRLGEAWRTVDPKRAQAWLDQAVTALTPPELESTDDHKAKLRTAYALFPG
jgi:hypothetical protein